MRTLVTSRLVRTALLLLLLLPTTAIVSRPASAVDAAESEFLEVINTYRANQGLPVLKLSPKLSRAADWMSADMGKNKYFSHTDSLGRDPFKRMAAFGYTYSAYKAENIAAGYELPEAVFAAWLKSEGHKRNIDNPNYRVIGIGRINVPGSPYAWYWTTKFGSIMDTSTSTVLANYVYIDGSTYHYNSYREVRVSGTVVGKFATMPVKVAVQKQVYDSVKKAYVWKAYQTYTRTLSSESRYSVAFKTPAGKFRVRTTFAGNGSDIRPSVSAFKYFDNSDGVVSSAMESIPGKETADAATGKDAHARDRLIKRALLFLRER